MSDATETPAPRKAPRASLGSSEGDDIFGTFDINVARRFLAYLKPHKNKLAIAQVAVLITAICQIAIPKLIGTAVNQAVGHDASGLDRTLIAFGIAAAVSAVFFFVGEWLSSRLAQRVIFDVRRAMFAHFQDVSLSFMDKTHVGRIMSRLQGDVNALQEFLENMNGAVGDFVMLVGITIVLLTTDLKLGLLTLTVLPALIAIRAIWLPHSKKSFREARDASSTANSALAENINGIRTVQESRREALNFDLYKDKAHENYKAQVGASWMTQIMVPTVDVLTGFAMAVVVIVGGEAVMGGRLDVGVMVTFILYVQRFFEPVRMLSMQYTIMQRAMAAGHRIFEVIDVPVTISDKPDAVELKDVAATVEFRNVTFGYDPKRPILHDISLTVRPKEVVALVGPTGSGKTSIIALTHRFYEVDQGQVLVGGHDVRDVSLDSLGRTIGMVLQEPFLFTGTIEQNIRYNTAASRERIVEAAKSVSAHDFIMRLPDGYETQLGQRGRNISMGQRQLISFARALVADPQILILDEATANIDSFTEQAIQKALKVLFAGRTCMVIAHRLATIRDADRIVVLQQGRILEQGSHDELMRNEAGLYSHLYTSAHASFDDQVVAVTGDTEFATRT
jgi:ATP-binding cassette subfamily B multidrug efflux pump